MRTQLALPATAVVVLVAAACGSESATSTGTAVQTTETDDTDDTVETVTLLNSRFDPTEVSIGAGGTVTWTNADPFAHTITSADGSSVFYDSGSIGQDASFEMTYDDVGTFAYFCQIHPTMRGTVTVTG